MNSRLACVDASLVLMLLLPDEHSNEVDALFAGWALQGVRLVGPPLLYVEVPSVIRAAVFFERISPEEGERAFETFCALDIEVSASGDLHLLAWDLAKEFRRPRLYDSTYLAVARSEGCDLWTGDLRLANAVDRSWVKWVGADSG